jgi:hypothetical protein
VYTSYISAYPILSFGAIIHNRAQLKLQPHDTRHMDRIMREVTKIKLHSRNVNREDGFFLIRA